VEHVVNTLMNMKEAPGISLKSKSRRGVLSALLTNNAYLKIGWVQKQDSSQAAISQLQDLTRELNDAKDANAIRETEGKITGLMEKLSLLEPSGPTMKLVSPFRMYVDPTAKEPDHSDANWMAEYDFLPTSYIRAVYGKPGDNENSVVSVYEPTHVLNANSSVETNDEQVNTFSLINQTPNDDASIYGYKDNNAFIAAQYTKVWWVWDKTTRRVFLYADNAWEWPLWVWDDPLNLLRFYPYFRLWFHETPDGAQPKGEVTYYLDQQDAINEVNSEIAQARKWARRNIFYNKNGINQDDVEQILKGPDGTARGLDIPEGTKLADMFYSIIPPALSHPELFDNTKRFESINRITGINDALHGGQFKTNTTNQAIQTYEGSTDVRVDEKMDAIEDWIGDVGWSLAQLCLRYWTTQDVTDLIGSAAAEGWQQITDAAQLRAKLNLRVVGGSLEKPTSKNKQKQALAIGQVLGQFANSIPAAGMVLLKVFERAFDNMVITEEDWDGLLQSMQDAQHQAGSGPGGPGAEQGEQGTPGAPQPGAPQGAPGQPPGAVPPEAQGTDTVDPAQAQVIAQQIASLPPDLRQHMQQLIARGVSPTDALKEVTKPTPAPRITAERHIARPQMPPSMKPVTPPHAPPSARGAAARVGPSHNGARTPPRPRP
jgi:hypothetical protein